MPRILCLFGTLLLFAMSLPAQGQAPGEASDSGTAQSVVEEGYLLAGKLHLTPDPFSDEVEPVGRDERVRVIPAAGKPGWFAVYRRGATTPAGFAFRPYVSRLGSSDLASLQQSESGTVPQRTLPAEPSPGDAESPGGRLPSVVFQEGLTASDGVLTQVERWANVRSGPGVGNEAFGVIRPFTPFRVVAIDRGWGKIVLDGEPSVGYVSGSLLHRVEEVVAEPVVDTEPEGRRSGVTLAGEAAGGRSLGGATVGDPAAGGAADVEDADVLPGVEEATGIVYVTRTGHKYHRESCKHLRSVKFAIPLAEAMLDFAPCRTCTPPTRVPEDAPEDGPAPESDN